MSLKSSFTLRELARRISEGTSQPDTKPLFVHWSDASALLEIAKEIYELEQTNQRLRAALEGALIMIAEGKK